MYPLTPVISEPIKQIVADSQQIHQWLRAFGSPLNLIFPEAVESNVASFDAVLKQHKVSGDIFYAFKANKSQAIVKQLSLSSGKIDVASEKELQRALAGGFSGSRIEATGPKNHSFLRLALQHAVLVNLNSLDELEQILALRKTLGLAEKTRIVVRIKEFRSSHINIMHKDAKFGLNLDDVPRLLETLQEHRSDVDFLGYSFHLTTTSPQERIVAIEQLAQLTLESFKIGLQPRVFNIGGGFRVNYLQSAEQWQNYNSAIKAAALDPSLPAMSWNASGLGYWSQQGKLRGSASFSSFYQSISQFQELDAILSTPIRDFGSVAEFLQENMLTLQIEPGRALLDQAGVTLARVASTNTSLKGEPVLFLDMNRTHLNATELEFMSDPLFIPQDISREYITDRNGLFLSGNLCLPHDFVSRRRVFLPKKPQVNDALAFINTAAYLMDFGESQPIQQALAPKIAINQLGWSQDEHYQPNYS